MIYSSTRKVIKLHDEQINIFNNITDGAMIHQTHLDIRKLHNKMVDSNRKKGQIVNTEPAVLSLNYTLKQMLGISIHDVNSVHDS
jgi:hypothetical protein